MNLIIPQLENRVAQGAVGSGVGFMVVNSCKASFQGDTVPVWGAGGLFDSVHFGLELQFLSGAVGGASARHRSKSFGGFFFFFKYAGFSRDDS